jgi:outer membrane protein OmpA-like peptidoglycan-associated protein
MKLLISFLIVIHIVVFTSFSQTDFRYTESVKEVQEYLLNNDFTESLFILKKLEKDGYSNANMDYLLGVCCLNSLTEKSISVTYLKRASGFISKDYNPDDPAELKAPAEALLYWGDANLANVKIKEARQCYLRYLNLPYLDENKKDIARLRLKNCLFARLQIDNPLRIQLENAGKIINSGIANSNACVSADGKKMVFARTMKFYDAVFYTEKMDSGWMEPKNITTQIGSDGEYTPTALSPDGTRILLKSFSEPNGYEIYESVFNGRKWTKVKRLDAPVNSKYHDIDASYGADGTTLFFSSNRAGGIGGYDIYKAILNTDTKNYTVENVGNAVNSVGDEKSPSVIENGKVLVFNSNFYNSIGGYDYYYSQLLNGTRWSEPLDIGYPINSTFNDNDLRFSATSPKKGFLSQYNSKGHTINDIYFFDCPAFSTLKLIPLSGKIKINDTTYNGMQNITLAVVDVAEKDTALVLNPNDDGSYYGELYPGKFNLVVKKNGVKELEKDFFIPKDYKDDSFPLDVAMNENTPVTPLKNDTIFMVDILFDFNQWGIKESEKQFLKDMVGKLKSYTIKSIHLYGYTDALGSEVYNKSLSAKRANSVKEYIVEQGFDENNIIVEGKGNNYFVAENTKPGGMDNPEGRAFNRRVEFYISLENNTVVILKKDRVPVKLKINK